MPRQALDFTTPQPNGKVGDLAPAAFHKIDENFEELYKSWTNVKNKILSTDANGAPQFTDVASFGLQCLAMADASSFLTKLGFSDFVKTLVDDINASAFLDTLGAGVTGKSLFSAANAANARSTLALNSAALMSVIGTVVSGGTSGALFQYIAGSDGASFGLRIADGTQLVCGSSSDTLTANGAYGSGYMSAPAYTAYPAAFSSVPRVFYSTHSQNNGISSISSDTTPSVSSCSARIFSFVQNATAKYAYFAIGRWN